MHLEERGMSGPINTAKPIFPIPISGQVSPSWYIYTAKKLHREKNMGKGKFYMISGLF